MAGAKMPKLEEIKEILTSKPISKDEFERISGLDRIRRVYYYKFFVYFGFSKAKLFKYLKSQGKKNYHIKRIEDMIDSSLESLGLTIEELKPKKSKAKKAKDKLEREIETTKKGLKNIIDVFHLGKDADFFKHLERLDDEDFTEESIVPLLKEVFKEFMKKALGKSTSKKVSTAYVVEVNENGEITKKDIKENQAGQKVIYEEITSMPPDPSAFGQAMVVLEVIRRFTGAEASEFITDEEEHNMYLQYLEDVKAKKEEFGGREFQNGQIIEDADIEELD